MVHTHAHASHSTLAATAASSAHAAAWPRAHRRNGYPPPCLPTCSNSSRNTIGDTVQGAAAGAAPFPLPAPLPLPPLAWALAGRGFTSRSGSRGAAWGLLDSPPPSECLCAATTAATRVSRRDCKARRTHRHARNHEERNEGHTADGVKGGGTGTGF
jgi:hypothetical protein